MPSSTISFGKVARGPDDASVSPCDSSRWKEVWRENVGHSFPQAWLQVGSQVSEPLTELTHRFQG